MVFPYGAVFRDIHTNCSYAKKKKNKRQTAVQCNIDSNNFTIRAMHYINPFDCIRPCSPQINHLFGIERLAGHFEFSTNAHYTFQIINCEIARYMQLINDKLTVFAFAFHWYMLVPFTVACVWCDVLTFFCVIKRIHQHVFGFRWYTKTKQIKRRFQWNRAHCKYLISRIATWTKKAIDFARTRDLTTMNNLKFLYNRFSSEFRQFDELVHMVNAIATDRETEKTRRLHTHARRRSTNKAFTAKRSRRERVKFYRSP